MPLTAIKCDKVQFPPQQTPFMPALVLRLYYAVFLVEEAGFSFHSPVRTSLPLVTNSQQYPSPYTHLQISHSKSKNTGVPKGTTQRNQSPVLLHLRTQNSQGGNWATATTTKIFPWCNATSSTFPGPQFPKNPGEALCIIHSKSGRVRRLRSRGARRKRTRTQSEKARVI